MAPPLAQSLPPPGKEEQGRRESEKGKVQETEGGDELEALSGKVHKTEGRGELGSALYVVLLREQVGSFSAKKKKSGHFDHLLLLFF